MNTTNKTAVEEIVEKLFEDTFGITELMDSFYITEDAVRMEVKIKKSFKQALTQAHQQGEREGVERCIPKEKPMNTFSFVLKGEELELYNQHKGWNKCREAMKALQQPLPDKE